MDAGEARFLKHVRDSKRGKIILNPNTGRHEPLKMIHGLTVECRDEYQNLDSQGGYNNKAA